MQRREHQPNSRTRMALDRLAMRTIRFLLQTRGDDSSQASGATLASLRRGLFHIALVAALLIGALIYAQESRSTTYAPPPSDSTLGPFDPATARKLTPERRREYDVRFFNEVHMKNHHPTDPRYQVLKKMADEGFEVAHLALRLFDIRLGGDRYRPEAWPRLKALAAEGDLSAVCLRAKYAYVFEPKLDQRVVFAAIRGAAEAGHPHCSGIYAQYFRTGKLVAPNPQQYVAWETKAAKGGDLLAQLILADLYATGQNVPVDLARARCWLEEALRSDQTAKTWNDAQSIRFAVSQSAARGFDNTGVYLLGTGCEVRSEESRALGKER